MDSTDRDTVDPQTVLFSLQSLQEKYDSILNVQQSILTQVLHLREDVKLLLTGTGTSRDIIRVNETIPTHPISTTTEMNQMEDWIQTSENYITIVSLYNV